MDRREFLFGLTGAAIFDPAVAGAQRGEQTHRVGVLMSTANSDPQEVFFVSSFIEALANAGWIAGRNVEILPRWSDGDAARMAANARELVAMAPDVMLVKGASVPAVAELTSTIPIVFVVLSDVRAENIVGSFARPRGNITGFTSYERELVGKRLALLRELSPALKEVLYLRTQTAAEGLLTSLSGDAAKLGLSVTDGVAKDDADIEHAFKAFAAKDSGGVVVAFDAFTSVHQSKIIELALEYQLPAIYPLRIFVQAGGLIAYGLDQADQFRQAASYIARILAGVRPSDLPVQAPTKFELDINLKTARALGLTIPPTVVARADEVIE